MPELTIVIPAYNEADRIAANLEAVADYVSGNKIDADIIVVDDGSTDETQSIVKGIIEKGLPCPARLLPQRSNRGKGAAVRRGMLEATGEKRMFMDADLATPLEELGRLLPYLGQADVVIASRALTSSNLPTPQPPHRRLMGWVFRQLVRMAGVHDIRDSQCGFKLFTSRSATDIFSKMKEDGFAFDVEALWLAQHLGYSIKEVGITWSDSGRSSVNPLWDPVMMLITLLKIRWRSLFTNKV